MRTYSRTRSTARRFVAAMLTKYGDEGKSGEQGAWFPFDLFLAAWNILYAFPWSVHSGGRNPNTYTYLDVMCNCRGTT